MSNFSPLIRNINSKEILESSLKSLEQKDKLLNHEALRAKKISELMDEVYSFKMFEDYEECIPLYRKLIYIDGKNPLYYAELSEIYILLGDLSSAITYRMKSVLCESNLNLKETKDSKSLDDRKDELLDLMLFCKGALMIESNLIDSDYLTTISTDMSEINYLFLR